MLHNNCWLFEERFKLIFDCQSWLCTHRNTGSLHWEWEKESGEGGDNSVSTHREALLQKHVIPERRKLSGYLLHTALEFLSQFVLARSLPMRFGTRSGSRKQPARMEFWRWVSCQSIGHEVPVTDGQMQQPPLAWSCRACAKLRPWPAANHRGYKRKGCSNLRTHLKHLKDQGRYWW